MMKITKEIFKNIKKLKILKKIKKKVYCNGFGCSKCPLNNDNLNDDTQCTHIINLPLYREKDPEAIKAMDKLIDIFTKEKINSILSKLAPNRSLKYNDYVVYNDKTFKIKGVLNKKEISFGTSDPILLSGYDICNYSPEYASCIVSKKAIKKEYTLWVNPSEIFALNDIVIERESNIEYKIVAIDKTNRPILLNDRNNDYFNINDLEEENILCSLPEAYEEGYSKWTFSHNIKHK